MFYPDSLPYLKTLTRTVVLPPGSPRGRGNLVFLFSRSPSDAISMMNQKENCYSNGYYYYYFYQPRYIGHVVFSESTLKTASMHTIKVREPKMKRMYRLNDMHVRDEIYAEVDRSTSIHPYPKKMEIMETETRNTFFDLSRYYYIFNNFTVASSAKVKFVAFWNLFESVFMESYGNLKNKMVLINASLFPYDATDRLANRLSNPLYMIYYSLYKFYNRISDIDIDFIIYRDKKVMKFNPSKCTEKSHKIYLNQLKILYKGLVIEDLSIENEINDEELEKDAENEILLPNKKLDEESPIETGYKKSGNVKEESRHIPEVNVSKSGIVKFDSAVSKSNIENIISQVPEPLKARIEEKKIASMMTAQTTNEQKQEEEVTKQLEAEIESDEKLLKDIYDAMIVKKSPSSQRSTARDKLIREKQKDIKVKGISLAEISNINPKETEIKKVVVEKSITSINPNMKEMRFQNFNESYINKNIMGKDIMGAFEKLNDASIPMYILDVDVVDSSDVLNLKETWTVRLEDVNRNRHTIKVDIPKFVDKNFLWLGGNKKIIKNQNFFLPVVKITNNRVMIVTNYNKMTMERVDSNTLQAITLIEKHLPNSPELQKYFKVGSATIENHGYLTGLEYDEYAKRFLEFHHGKFVIWFSQKKATEEAKKRNIEIPKDKFFIGMNNDIPIFIHMDRQKTDDNLDISALIWSKIPEEDIKKIEKIKIPKRLMYTKATTMKQDVPIVILMCLWEGLSSVLQKADVKFRLANDLKNFRAIHENFIRFADCYLIYESTVQSQLILNGLYVLNTSEIAISEMDKKEAYIPYIQKKFGKLSILNALNNVYEFTIGKIEEEILMDMHLPIDLISLMVYANSLLADNQYLCELDLSQSRIRCAEIIPGILYDCLAKAYVPFKNSNGKRKLSIPQDIVIRKLLELRTVEDYSSLNPFLELESTHGVSTKGFKGVNLEDSYTVPKRSYDPSMVGVIGISSPPDAQVGVNRTLTMEPRIKSVRGYIDVADDLENVKDINLFSPAEMLIPLGVSRDDPIRTGHSVKQSRASIPIKEASPTLITNGSDEICKYYLSSDFVVMAEQDGKVIEMDPISKIMIVEYKDGSHQAINLDKNIVKNGGGGFELSNILITDLKVGDKFKANDTLAWHDKFFKKIPGQGVRLCIGARIKVALFSSYNTYEDANFITEKVAKMCETEMTFRIPVAIGRNSNIYKMVKEGDEVAVGDSLIEFDESFEDSDVNKLLAHLGDNEELKEAVASNNKNTKKSKYSGVIEKIKIYSASELEDLSPSVRSIVGNYYDGINKKKSILSKYDPENSKSPLQCGMMLTEMAGKTQPDRYGNIRGVKVDDGVLIEFYVKHGEPLEIGSKVANYSPLKNIVSEIIPAGYEPISEFRPEEEISSIISPSSILNRMVASVLPTILGNKCIVELKRSLEVIWKSNKDFSEKRKDMESLIYKFFTAFDKSGDNTRRYKEFFHPMSDAQFKKFFTEFFKNEDHFLTLEIVDYERTIMIEDIERAAKVINIPLFEYVYFYHYTMDKEHPIVTKHKIPTGYLHLKRPQQTVMKKNGGSTSSEQRSGFTGQVTGADKNGRESDLENCMLVSMGGMENTLKELNGPRADDLVMKKEMLQQIQEAGYLQLSELTDEIENKTTLNTIDTYFLGMHLRTDLTNKGLRLPYINDIE